MPFIFLSCDTIGLKSLYSGNHPIWIVQVLGSCKMIPPEMVVSIFWMSTHLVTTVLQPVKKRLNRYGVSDTKLRYPGSSSLRFSSSCNRSLVLSQKSWFHAFRKSSKKHFVSSVAYIRSASRYLTSESWPSMLLARSVSASDSGWVSGRYRGVEDLSSSQSATNIWIHRQSVWVWYGIMRLVLRWGYGWINGVRVCFPIQYAT